MQYAWLLWSLLLLIIWAVVYFSLKSKESKREMLIVSFWTGLFGLTEPLFVPEYWAPPSLLNLAMRTGFDIESIIFAFAVGGIAVVIYEWVFRTRHRLMTTQVIHSPRHRYHLWALLSFPVILAALLLVTSFNPIYSVIIALICGGLATWYCRPDLKKKMAGSAFLFLGAYFLFFLTLVAVFPGYVETVWNIGALSGILIAGIPLEELLFAFSFGFLWSSVYEHLTWQRLVTAQTNA